MALTAEIFNIKRYAIHDGPGIRTTVFFAGCPLDCWWCHNPECRFNGHLGKVAGICAVTVDELMEELRKDLIFYEQSGGGVTLSGGEPMLHVDFVAELLRACKREGIDTALDTCGHGLSEEYARIHDLVDLILYDLKLIDDEAHVKYTGVSNQSVLSNLAMLSSRGHKVRVRFPLIPGMTTTEVNLSETVGYLAGLKNIDSISLLPYNQFGEDKRRRYHLPDRLGHVTPLNDAEIADIRDRFEQAGYEVKVGG